jgi:hypothetical protein
VSLANPRHYLVQALRRAQAFDSLLVLDLSAKHGASVALLIDEVSRFGSALGLHVNHFVLTVFETSLELVDSDVSSSV